MAKVLGVGGFFFLCKDVDATREWYSRVLGIEINDFGGHMFSQANAAGVHGPGAMTIWSPYAGDSDYFQPSTHNHMINFMVDDLDGMIAQIRDQDVPLEGDPTTEPYGKFAWVMDPDGRKIELWQPLAP